jgi:enhancing lycopene biosynthesis protein 2
MNRVPKVVVLLSGCGVSDGSEIHEATLSLLALDLRGARAIPAAPDCDQARVFDHQAGRTVPGAQRNCRAEAARIARGPVKTVGELRVEEFDAVLIPGGYGAALNLSNLASAGPALEVERSVSSFLAAAFQARKPIAALCIAPPILARMLKDLGVAGASLTIGRDPGTAAIIASLGQNHVDCPADCCVVDERNRIVTCPAYMVATSLSELWRGVDATVDALLKLT